MFKVFGLLLICVVLIQETSAGPGHKIFQKYSEMRMIEMCLGKENIGKHIMKVVEQVMNCNEDSGSGMQHKKKPHPMMDPNQPFFGEEKIRKLKNRVVDKFNNMSCVLAGMNYLDSDDNLQFNAFKNDIREMNLNSELQNDLVKGVEMCEAFVSCADLSQMPSLCPPKMKKAMMFNKCLKESRNMACIKNDLRKMTDQFELDGLDGIVDHLSEDDQRLAVVWAEIQMSPMEKSEMM